MARTGKVLGYVGIVFILLVLAAVEIPSLLVSPIAVNEASAMRGLRAIRAATVTYSDSYRRGYPPSLAALEPTPVGGTASADAANLLDKSLASGSSSGYVFHYQSASSHGDGVFDGFDANADPISPGKTGYRHFHVDESGVIRVENSAPAGRNSPTLQ
jgi:type II secretory pathway pseudopilin PulG